MVALISTPFLAMSDEQIDAMLRELTELQNVPGKLARTLKDEATCLREKRPVTKRKPKIDISSLL